MKTRTDRCPSVDKLERLLSEALDDADRTVVETHIETCADCVCNVNAAGGITATDALTVLQYAVGLVPELTCPPCL